MLGIGILSEGGTSIGKKLLRFAERVIGEGGASRPPDDGVCGVVGIRNLSLEAFCLSAGIDDDNRGNARWRYGQMFLGSLNIRRTYVRASKDSSRMSMKEGFVRKARLGHKGKAQTSRLEWG